MHVNCNLLVCGSIHCDVVILVVCVVVLYVFVVVAFHPHFVSLWGCFMSISSHHRCDGCTCCHTADLKVGNPPALNTVVFVSYLAHSL